MIIVAVGCAFEPQIRHIGCSVACRVDFCSAFLTVNVASKQTSTRPFYVGVEFDYGNQFSQLKALVDQVKDYTNLFVIGSVGLPFNGTALDESCDYIFNSGLNFIVLFTSFTMYYSTNGWVGYTIFDWIVDARQKYGEQFLGIYRFDQPREISWTKASLCLSTTPALLVTPMTPLVTLR